MVGKPKFKQDEEVLFAFPMEEGMRTLKGTIYIIDAYGTFFDDSDVSYDILVEEMNTLFKHVPEKDVHPLSEGAQ